MGIYVDIDLDFLVKPIKQEGINNKRLYKGEECFVSDIEEFILNLKEHGLLNTKQKKFFTNHKKSYTYWWINRSLNNTVIHIDAHSDLYRNKQENLTLLKDTDMNCDDYMWYAIRDGFISKIYWVVPYNSYNLNDPKVAEKFVPQKLVKSINIKNNCIDYTLEVITRLGIKNIEYSILTFENLPNFKEIELLTVATSPEFYSEKADTYIFKALSLLGATEEELERIKKFHEKMI
ncbi:hypothetical protein SAMN05660865_01015 [Caloramator fervidus]|uniref:Uncharacterized protein n=1 Tax=Caloramator fervidus TaxID=29344 RepID=A0A1H5UVC2_9CLOT|nr:hypothetical protein [Caloramator fervidus]SEF78904.1 hypothetical protein SAMN05660865_01015 [Caloramator fervidus]